MSTVDPSTDAVVDARDYYTPMLRSMLYDKVPRAMKKSAVTREGTVSTDRDVKKSVQQQTLTAREWSAIHCRGATRHSK